MAWCIDVLATVELIGCPSLIPITLEAIAIKRQQDVPVSFILKNRALDHLLLGVLFVDDDRFSRSLDPNAEHMIRKLVARDQQHRFMAHLFSLSFDEDALRALGSIDILDTRRQT